MIETKHLQLFEKYRDASGHAFSNGIVTEDDKDLYWELYEWLSNSVHNVASSFSDFDIFKSRLSRDGGVQGQRPKDIWASIINKNSDAFGKYPQVFAIANANGIEIGFSLAIHERDYFNADVKLRARAMLPSLYRKLPEANSRLVSAIDDAIDWQNWKAVVRHRGGIETTFLKLSDMLQHHRSDNVDLRGGGTVFTVISETEVSKSDFNLESRLRDVISIFRPLMKQLSPSGPDIQYVLNQTELDAEIQSVEEFLPDDETDGKTYKLRKLAERLGQPKFRSLLIDAYSGTCAVSGTREISSLQAAHISPYDGNRTNKVTNGILLRADIHNLFDRGLIYICPESNRVVVSPTINCPTYTKFIDQLALLPNDKKKHPSKKYLSQQRDKYLSIHA